MNRTRRKRLFCGIGLLFVFVLAGVLLLSRTHVRILGYFKGEAFLDGMPTSHWREVVKEQRQPRPPRVPTLWDKVLAYLGWEPAPPERLTGATRDAAIPVLLELLKDDDPEVRLFAADALRLNGNAKLAGPTILELLDHADAGVRRSAAYVLRNIVRDSDPISRSAYFSALERMGAAARPALPYLTKLLETQPDVYLATVVWSIDPENALARLLLKQGLQNSQEDCEETLRQFRYPRPTRLAAELILDVLRDARLMLSPAHRQLLVEALEHLDPAMVKARTEAGGP